MAPSIRTSSQTFLDGTPNRESSAVRECYVRPVVDMQSPMDISEGFRGRSASCSAFETPRPMTSTAFSRHPLLRNATCVGRGEPSQTRKYNHPTHCNPYDCDTNDLQNFVTFVGRVSPVDLCDSIDTRAIISRTHEDVKRPIYSLRSAAMRPYCADRGAPERGVIV